MAPITKSERVPKPMQEKFDAIVALTDTFCRAFGLRICPLACKPLQPCAVNVRLHSRQGT